jgi:hypothetical protein
MTTMTTNPMPTGERKVGPARLRVRQCTALPERMRAKTREIVDVETPFAEQGKGYATTLLHKVYGDNINLSKDQLTEWYERSFGFHVIQHQPMVLMARMANGTPRMLTLNPVTEAIQKAKTP